MKHASNWPRRLRTQEFEAACSRRACAHLLTRMSSTGLRGRMRRIRATCAAATTRARSQDAAASGRKPQTTPARETLDALAFSVAVRYLASQRPTLLGNPSGRQKLSVPDCPALCARSTGEKRGMRRSSTWRPTLDREGGWREPRAQRKGGIGPRQYQSPTQRERKLLKGKSSWTGRASYRNGAQVAGREHGPWRFGKRATVAPQTRPHVPAGDANRQRRGAPAPDRQSRPTESGDDSGDSQCALATGFDSV
jgi:hypothetical protein